MSVNTVLTVMGDFIPPPIGNEVPLPVMDPEELHEKLLEKNRLIALQVETIERLRNENALLRREVETLLQLLHHESSEAQKKNPGVTSADNGVELRDSKSRSRSVGGSPHEASRNSKLVSQQTVTSGRVQRQRSLRRSEDEAVKRSRAQSVAYELSQDLQDKQVEMLERKYGGSLRSRRAAKTIQRAFRQYCMSKNFEKLRNSIGDRRLSKLGRSNTVWSDRISADGQCIMGATVLQNGPDITSWGQGDFGHDYGRPAMTDETIKKEIRLRQQMSLDPNYKSDSPKLKNRSDRRRLERSMEVEANDIPIQKDSRLRPNKGEENNNRNSCPEMNDSSASDSPQVTPFESTVDIHSVDFENLLESKDTDILTDSFQSDASQDINLTIQGMPNKSASGMLLLGSSNDTLGSNRSISSSYENFRSQADSSDTGSASSSQNDLYKDRVSPEHLRTQEQKHMQEQTVKYFMNSEGKQRGNRTESDNLKRPPVVPGRGPEASPIWKRKNNGSTSSLKSGDIKRMSNISETSEPESLDGGHYSSSPSSENISSENISITSDTSISYQRRMRLSMTPDHSNASVPRSADKQRKRVYRIGLNLFNKKPEKGLQFLCENGFINDSPDTVARFLITRKGLSKQMIGEYLGNISNDFNMEVLSFFCEEIDLSGLQVDVALRKFQSHFRMPGEAQKIERLMDAFAERYVESNPDQVKNFKNPATVFLLAFAIIMLNTDLHNASIKPERKMKLEDFIKNLRGIDEGDELDRDLLSGIYERIKAQEFRPGVDHVTQVMKVEQTIVGKKPQLALPHRRLVCYCRLYEVHDSNKKEKIGLHQREVFLFNDLLLVTKIFSKKKTGITYSFKQSFSLCDMSVIPFETSHYQFGIRLINHLDGKLLITFNSRNDHDRQKFVEDLREAILETNGMEQFRIDELQRQNSSHANRDRRPYSNDDTSVMMYDYMKSSDPSTNSSRDEER
ncbi:hypothetical protein ACJMK2_015511 [Sinanodonta woodiana]|uniref:SEC7 domain-containing protein n=1 Tax=Sinanodonta woodiana TaxID=1069815 RepID=A0ABD3URU3_SINWO